MDWLAFLVVVIIALKALSLLFVWVWPRNGDGSFMSVKEVEHFLNRFPRPPTDRAKRLVIGIFVTLAMIGVALTKHFHEDVDAGD